jgi:hypothetical protein
LPEFREHDIKAVFLFRFLQLVEWPPDAFAGGDSPIVVAVLGANPFGEALSDTVRNEMIDGRRIVVRYAMQLKDLSPAHLLFVTRETVVKRADLLAYARDHGTLIVGESPDFINAGGAVNFYIHEHQVRFEICPEAVERARLRVRSRLLRLARLVECGPFEETR